MLTSIPYVLADASLPEPVVFTVEELSQMRWAVQERIRRFANVHPGGTSMNLCNSALNKIELELAARQK